MLLKTLIFTALIPGTTLGILPWVLLVVYGKTLSLESLRFLGVVPTITGLLLYVVSVSSFLVQGGGTPAIWFSQSLSFLIGKEPHKLVLQGFYNVSRNPMYLGVVVLVVGLGMLLESAAVLLYAFMLWVLFELVVVLLEEPHLRRKYGTN